MSTEEAATASLGPRYAPDDPTLPKPWKGLIDGSTGVMYYWNPETNVTQYEKPASVAPQLPLGPPQVAASSCPGGEPVAMQSNYSMPQLEQPIGDTSQQVMQHHNNQLPQHNAHQFGQPSQQQQQQQLPMQYMMNQLPQQHGQSQGAMVGQFTYQQTAQITQSEHRSQRGQALQQPYADCGQGSQPIGTQNRSAMTPATQQQFTSLAVHQASHNLLPQAGQHVAQQTNQQMLQLGHREAPHQSPTIGHQLLPQQMQGSAYQHPQHMEGQPNVQHQTNNMLQGPPFSQQQVNVPGVQRREHDNVSNFKHSSYSQTQNDQAANAGPPVHMMQVGVHPSPSQSFGSSSHMQQPTTSSQMQKSGSEAVYYQHGSTLQNQMGPLMLHSQHPGLAPVRPNMGYEDQQRRTTPEYYSHSKKEGSILAPKVVAAAGNQQDLRMDAPLFKDAPPGHVAALNSVDGHALPNPYNHVRNGLPVANHSMTRASPMIPGSPNAMNLTQAEVYRQQHEVTATGGNVPAPFMTFEATGFPPEILREMHAAGFSSPTPIQAQTWPIALQQRDIVAIAKTGSGKTLGYLIPAFLHLKQRQNNPHNGPTVLVLVPTRELVVQIQLEAIKFGRSSRVTCTCLYGGTSKALQLKELERGTDIVVATPGRLNDILEMRKLNVRQISLLILDEADRMLDMGFEPQIRKIVNEIPRHRQTLMYTATWPKEVVRIASDLLVNPVQVNIGSIDELAANKSITQHVEVVPHTEKQRRLEQILISQERGSKVIVFCSTKKMCDELVRNIRRSFAAAAIHGDKSQAERDWVLGQFRTGRSPVLVATDVAARGLDIKDVRVVINYDFPTSVEDYVHRIGRTGRAGASGLAYTFFSEQDWKHAADLVKVLEGANQQVPPQVREIALRGGPGFGRDRGGINRFESGIPAGGGGRWDSSRRGGRDGGFGGRGGMRDGGFGGRGGMRDGFGGRGGRDNFPVGRGNRGRGFGGGWGRDDHGPPERFNNRDNSGRGRFGNRRDGRGRSRSRSRSPERVRTWGYSRSSSRSRSRSLSRSRSRSWSRGRSRSPRRSYSRSRSPYHRRSRNYSRSHSRSYDSRDGYKRSVDQATDRKDPVLPETKELLARNPESRSLGASEPKASGEIRSSHMRTDSLNDQVALAPVVDDTIPSFSTPLIDEGED